ncbi:MAG: tetratricopeptide repeat protein [Succinivibrionaceae bacterium]
MSVINKTLTELNKRNSSNVYGKYTPTNSRSINMKIVFLCLVILILVVYNVWLFYVKTFDENKEINNKEQVSKNIVATKPLKQEIINISHASNVSNVTSSIVDKEEKVVENVISNKEKEINVKEDIKLNVKNNLPRVENNINTYDEQVDKALDINFEKNINEYEKPSKIKVVAKKLSKEEIIELNFRKANSALVKGDKKEALQSLEDILKIEPNNIKAREKLASVYYGINNYTKAIELLDKGIRIQPNHYDYRLYLARIYSEIGDYQKAIKVLSLVNPPVASNVDYYAMLGNLARESNDFDTAVKAYRKLSTINTKEGRWYLGLAIVLEKKGNNTEALENYKRATNLYLSSASMQFANKRIKYLESVKNDR